MSKKKEQPTKPSGKQDSKPAAKADKPTTEPLALKPAAEPAKPAVAAKPVAEPVAKPAEAKAAPAPVAPFAPVAPAAKAAEKPAPAPAAKPAEKPAPAPAAKPAEKPAAPAAKAAEKPAATAKSAASAKAGKAATAKSGAPVTIVVAKYDVGHGNSLYIRGEGATLSWESGILMDNVGSDVWVWTTTQIAEGMIAFKFLINDEIWSAGDNMSASVGETTTLTPYF